MPGRFVLPAVAFLGLLGLTGMGPAPQTSPGPIVRSVHLDVALPGTSVAAIRAEVIATSDEQARTSATAALKVIAPGATVLEPDESNVTAQWRPWPWEWSPSEIPVPVAYNPTGAPSGVSPSVVVAGMEIWSSVPTSAFRYAYAGVTDNTGSILDFGPDGENVISWASLDCSQGCVLAMTSKKTAHEVDMVLNNNPAVADQLGVGSVVDWRTVILHELGHMAGLEHSCPVPFGPCTPAEADAVMYFQYRGILRKLAPDDIEGISTLYPVSGSSPTPGPSPTPTPFPEKPVILEDGWNLVVLPDLSVDALAGGLPCLQAVYLFSDDNWDHWIRSAPAAVQTLAGVGGSQSYWLLAKSACAHDFP